MQDLLDKRIQEQIQAWKSLEPVLPIDGSEIKGFLNWINWNGFGTKFEYDGEFREHSGYDFSSYIRNRRRFLRKKLECVVGLPTEISIRAIADGRIINVNNPHDPELMDVTTGKYYTSVAIEHDLGDSRKLISTYCHVVPHVLSGRVRKGQFIARPYFLDPWNPDSYLVHLHFGLRDPITNLPYDPTLVFPELDRFVADPRGEKDNFRIIGLENQPEICQQNYEQERHDLHSL